MPRPKTTGTAWTPGLSPPSRAFTRQTQAHRHTFRPRVSVVAALATAGAASGTTTALAAAAGAAATASAAAAAFGALVRAAAAAGAAAAAFFRCSWRLTSSMPSRSAGAAKAPAVAADENAVSSNAEPLREICSDDTTDVCQDDRPQTGIGNNQTSHAKKRPKSSLTALPLPKPRPAHTQLDEPMTGEEDWNIAQLRNGANGLGCRGRTREAKKLTLITCKSLMCTTADVSPPPTLLGEIPIILCVEPTWEWSHQGTEYTRSPPAPPDALPKIWGMNTEPIAASTTATPGMPTTHRETLANEGMTRSCLRCCSFPVAPMPPSQPRREPSSTCACARKSITDNNTRQMRQAATT